MPEITLNERKYHFADCPKCGHRRPISPTDGLCWACGLRPLETVPGNPRQLSAAGKAMSDVAPEIKAALNAVDRRISEALYGNGSTIDDIRALIDERTRIEEKL